VVHYCSRDSQKLYFVFHKGNCKRIANLRENCVAKGEREQVVGSILQGNVSGDWFLPLQNWGEPVKEATLVEHAEQHFMGVIKLVIILFIKLRLISNGGIEIYSATHAGAFLEPVFPTISECMRGDDKFQCRQRDQIQRLLELPTVKAAAYKLRYGILLCSDVAEPGRHRDGLPDEFFHLLNDCFMLSPDVNDLLHELLPAEVQGRE
jgi:hypothetical protein